MPRIDEVIPMTPMGLMPRGDPVSPEQMQMGIRPAGDEIYNRILQEVEKLARAVREGSFEGIRFPEDIDADLQDQLPELMEDLGRPSLGPSHPSGSKYPMSTNRPTPVPRQIRGKHGLSDEEIQNIPEELQAQFREWMGIAATEDAIRALKKAGVPEARIGSVDDAMLEEEGGRYRHVPEIPELQDAVEPSPSDKPGPARYSPAEVSEQPGAMFDPRFSMMSEAGEAIPREDKVKQYIKALASGSILPITQKLGKGIDLGGREGEYEARRGKWLASRKRTKDTKAQRLKTRRNLNKRRGMGGRNRADQPWINVPRFPGESDSAYAARYGAFANMMGQGLGRSSPGDEMGPLLNYLLGMSQGSGEDRRQQTGLWMSELQQISQTLAVLDAQAVKSGDAIEGQNTSAHAVELRDRQRILRKMIDRPAGQPAGQPGPMFWPGQRN